LVKSNSKVDVKFYLKEMNMKEQDNKKEVSVESYLSDTIDPEKIVFPVTCWSGEMSLKSEGTDFLEKGNVDSLQELVKNFILSNRDPGKAPEERQKPQEAQRRAALGFILKPSFKKLPVAEQIAKLKEVCSKAGKYDRLERTWCANADSASRKKLMRMAWKYDEIVANENLEDFLRRGETFVEWAQRIRSEKPPHPRSREMRPKSRSERQLGKEMSNILSPRAYNFLTVGDGTIKFTKKEQGREVAFEVRGFSDKSETTLDFLFDRLAKKESAMLLKTKPQPADIVPLEKFVTALEKPEEHSHFIRSVPFTSVEMRNDLQIRITDKEVIEAIEELSRTEIKLEGKKVWWDGKEERYKNITLKSSIIDTTIVEESGKVAPRTGEPQHKFLVTFGLGWGMIFDNGIINKRYSCFPPEFYKANPGVRKLGRYLACFSDTTLKIGEACNILGYKEEVRNWRTRKQDIEAKLDELKKMKVIRSWERDKVKGADGRLKELVGSRTRWKIERRN